MIQIDKGVPLPGDGRSATAKYPFAQMEVGDSFFTESKSTSLHRNSKTKKLIGRKFTCRRVTENGVDGTRVWRVE